MKVLAVMADKSGCAFYRLVAPSQVLQKDGVDVTLDLGGDTTLAYRNKDGRISSMEPLDYDVIVLQLASTQDALDAIPLMQKQGIAVVIEIDDNYWAFERNHSMKQYYQQGKCNIYHMANACKMADLITVSTPALAQEIRTFTSCPIRVIRNCIPESYLTTPRKEYDGFRVGWSGNPHTHPRDLEVTGGYVPTVCRATGSTYFSLGTDISAAILGFDEGETLFTEWVPLKEYPYALNQMDVGIVPLKMSPFNESKSYLKGLEFAALGIPFVASPTSEYLKLNRHGVGLIAREKHQWFSQLKQLIKNTEYRTEFIQKGKEFAAMETYEFNAYQWAEAWEAAIKQRKNRKNRLTNPLVV